MCHQIGRFLNEPARSPSLSHSSTCNNFLRIGFDNLLLPVVVTILFGQVLMLVIWVLHNSIQEAQLMAEEKCNTMEEEVRPLPDLWHDQFYWLFRNSILRSSGFF